jgi:stage II sporulation protein D
LKIRRENRSSTGDPLASRRGEIAMLRVTIVAASLALLLAGADRAAPVGRAAVGPAASPAPAFAISGRGFGHGVGMSQYGALGLAQNGSDYASILAHYYPRTELGRAPLARVRVLLAEGRAAVRVASAAPFRVRDAAGRHHDLAAGGHELSVALRIETAEGPTVLRGPLRFEPGTAPLQLDGRRYRGSLEVASVRSRLRVVDVVALEQYLLGVVPREVPSQWPPEALKAQAVVARSYALAVRRKGAFDLYADVRSQVYGGVDAEREATNAAVRATAGEVLLYEGKVATTFFFSTSGGRTANVADVWPSSIARPYLVSVPDPYDAVSPHHTWGPIPLPPGRLRSALGMKGELLDVRTVANPSGRVRRVIGIGTAGEVWVAATAIRSALGLRSTWFRVAVLRLDRPKAARVTVGSRVELSGLVRGLPKVTLERRVSGGAWRPVAHVAPAADGTFASAVTAEAPTQYRLASGALRTGIAVPAVAPLVRLAAPREAQVLAGSARPLSLAGATVAVQRLEATAWKPVARTTLAASGTFSVQLELVPGRYRAVLSPGRGWSPGVSTPLEVVAP